MLDPLTSQRPPTVVTMTHEDAMQFTIGTFIPYLGFIVFAIYRLVTQQDTMAVLFALGGSLCIVIDPIINALGCCYFAHTDLVITTHGGRPVPWFMLASYGAFNGGLGYWWYTKLQDRMNLATKADIWKMFLTAYQAFSAQD